MLRIYLDAILVAKNIAECVYASSGPILMGDGEQVTSVGVEHESDAFREGYILTRPRVPGMSGVG